MGRGQQAQKNAHKAKRNKVLGALSYRGADRANRILLPPPNPDPTIPYGALSSISVSCVTHGLGGSIWRLRRWGRRGEQPTYVQLRVGPATGSCTGLEGGGYRPVFCHHPRNARMGGGHWACGHIVHEAHGHAGENGGRRSGRGADSADTSGGGVSPGEPRWDGETDPSCRHPLGPSEEQILTPVQPQ